MVEVELPHSDSVSGRSKVKKQREFDYVNYERCF